MQVEFVDREPPGSGYRVQAHNDYQFQVQAY